MYYPQAMLGKAKVAELKKDLGTALDVLTEVSVFLVALSGMGSGRPGKGAILRYTMTGNAVEAKPCIC